MCVSINITELIYLRKFNYVIIQLYLRYLLPWIILFISFLIQFLIHIYFFKYFSTSANYLSLNPPIPTVHYSPSSPFSLFPTPPFPHSLPPPLSLSPTLSLPHSPSFHSLFHHSFLFHFLQGRPNQRNEMPQGFIFKGT